MSKNKVIRIVIAVALVALTAVAVGLYVYGVAVNNEPPTKNLFRMLAMVCVCISGLIKIKNGGRRQSLKFYEIHFKEQIKDAFKDSFLRNKLLCAIRLYNENKLRKALKYLTELKPECKSNDDIYAVNLFLALTLTDCGLREEAVKVYMELVDLGITTTTVYGNLGSLHSALGNFNDAVTYSRLSIQNDEKNPAPYNNLAKLYFDNFDFENAKRYAHQALEINHKFRQSASLLAIIYSLEEDKENAEKYTHVAIASGETPERMKEALEYYTALHKDRKSNETEEND